MTVKRNVLLTPHLCLYLQKDFQQDVGQSSNLDQKRSGILFTTKNHKENGTESLNWWYQVQRKRTLSLPSHESIVSRNAQKQRRWKIIYTVLCRWGYDWNCFSHFYLCLSAQYLRSSLGVVWRMQSLPCKNRETCSGRTIWPIVCADKFVDENTYTFDRWSFAWRSIAKIQRTSGKASTTKSGD